MTLFEELCPKLSAEHGQQPVIALGIEGSANKVAVGIIRYDPTNGEYYTDANFRKTYITPAGQGFLPRETAWHHQQHIVALVRIALTEAKLRPADITCICYTKGPGKYNPHNTLQHAYSHKFEI